MTQFGRTLSMHVIQFVFKNKKSNNNFMYEMYVINQLTVWLTWTINPAKKGGWKDTSVVPTTEYLIPNLVNTFLEKK